MYLDEQDVKSFFKAIQISTPPGSRVLFSYLLEGALKASTPGCGRGIVEMSLRFSGEPLQWEVPVDGIEPFLESLGYQHDDNPDRFDLRKRYLEPIGESERPLGKLENLAGCRTAA